MKADPTRAHAGRMERPQETRRGNLQVIRIPAWDVSHARLSWLVHGFSTRTGGRSRAYRPGLSRGFDLNLGFTDPDEREIVTANRKLFLKAVCGGDEELQLITSKQFHSSLIRIVMPLHAGLVDPVILKGDGLMTGSPGVLLGIQTADCIPVLLADRRNRAVAAFHAGWRGTLARIVENGVGRMRLEFGSKPQDLVAAIGPGIGQCCFAVGEEVYQQFESQFAYAPRLFREVFDHNPVREKYPLLFLTARAPGHSNLGPSLHLDLVEANRRQLLQAGLKPAQIFVAGECTACHTERFFSHRKEQGFTGRMMSVIGINPGSGSARVSVP